MAQAGPHAVTPRAATAYERVAARLTALVERLGLHDQADAVQVAYHLLCAEALAFPAGRRRVRASRLNADGTPLQLAVTFGGGPPPLLLLADVGPVTAGVTERRAATCHVLEQLAPPLDAAAAVPELLDCLDELAPAGDRRLEADGAGAAWLGAGFAAGRPPAVKLYINARWGPAEARWARLRAFASRFGCAAVWGGVERAVPQGLTPLGVAVTVAGEQLRGRVYLAGFGLPYAAYERLAADVGGPALEPRMRRFGQVLLGAEYSLPTRSAVCSFGVPAGGLKVELCAHCAFRDDAEARGRCLRWLRTDGAGTASAYLDVLGAIGGAGGRNRHAYIGTDGEATTVYFNPLGG